MRPTRHYVLGFDKAPPDPATLLLNSKPRNHENDLSNSRHCAGTSTVLVLLLPMLCFAVLCHTFTTDPPPCCRQLLQLPTLRPAQPTWSKEQKQCAPMGSLAFRLLLGQCHVRGNAAQPMLSLHVGCIFFRTCTLHQTSNWDDLTRLADTTHYGPGSSSAPNFPPIDRLPSGSGPCRKTRPGLDLSGQQQDPTPFSLCIECPVRLIVGNRRQTIHGLARLPPKQPLIVTVPLASSLLPSQRCSPTISLPSFLPSFPPSLPPFLPSFLDACHPTTHPPPPPPPREKGSPLDNISIPAVSEPRTCVESPTACNLPTDREAFGH